MDRFELNRKIEASEQNLESLRGELKHSDINLSEELHTRKLRECSTEEVNYANLKTLLKKITEMDNLSEELL